MEHSRRGRFRSGFPSHAGGQPRAHPERFGRPSGPDRARTGPTATPICPGTAALKARVDVSATETRQIALNLLLNACEASPPAARSASAHGWVTTAISPAVWNSDWKSMDAGPGLPSAVAAALTEFGVMDLRDPPRGLGVRVVRDLVRGLRRTHCRDERCRRPRITYHRHSAR